MVILSRIYTKTGDAGTTALGDMSRTSKTDPRLVAYADTDEANCAIGEVVAGARSPEGREGLDDDVLALLTRIQNDLFDVGADLCAPLRPAYEYPPLRVQEQYVADLEAAIDVYNADLPALRSFVLPGGTLAAARLHTARTVVRRAERSTWEALERYGTEPVPVDDGPGGVSVLAAQYLNRLSDLLFVLSRHANREVGDVTWAPGGGRQEAPGRSDG
ncbi:cob(I)yrinic acid a,c-diamide adenosyltransferase [Aquipuribacter sp. SD81]|uniref:cob(I)yrinic acid a,c-diamide adenosyltransferase n=1 Tax=Aquipuribacter sp. SD81 TaxID=3127703 RepID=UPI003016A1B0